LDGKDAVLKSPDLLPEEQRIVGHHFLNELNGAFKTLFTTNFDIAAYNSLVGFVIFSLIGVPFAAAWAIMAAFLSLTRFFGPWLVFVPLSIFLFLMVDISKGFLVLLFGVALLEYVPEYILRPRISEGSSPVNIALAFLSYVAPVFALGLMGIIIGPFVYGLLIAAYRTALHFSEKRRIVNGEP
jgi:predicted PurR-regulated permease PerM